MPNDLSLREKFQFHSGQRRPSGIFENTCEYLRAPELKAFGDGTISLPEQKPTRAPISPQIW